MVLIDSTGAATPASSPVSASASDAGSYDPMGHVSVLASSTARLGMGRLLSMGYGSLPPRSAAEVTAKLSTSTSVRSSLDEYLAANASEHQAASLVDFGDKPLYVLTAGKGSDAAWMRAQDQTATLSTNSAHQVVDGAAHADLLLEKADAAVTTKAIVAVVTSVRNHQQLTK